DMTDAVKPSKTTATKETIAEEIKEPEPDPVRPAQNEKAASVKAAFVKADAEEEEEEEDEEDEEPESQGLGLLAASMAIYLVVIALGSALFEAKWRHVRGPGLPLAPWLVAVALKGKGEARRFKEYVLMFVAFYIYHRGKLQLQSELDSTFDPSDVVTVSMVGLAILCKEVGFAGVSMTMASLSTLLAAAVACVGMVYYSVWSCKFFHSPAEVRAGAAFGLLLVVLLKRLLGGSVAQEEEEEEESEAGYVALKA
ncbi:unnamed protein product, partial [Polarella glacialis]